MLTGKNLIILHSKCNSMCGMLRRLAYQQLSASGATGSIEFVVSPEVVRDEYVLSHTVAVVIGRPIGNGCKEFVSYYGRLKKKYGLRIIIDYDDCLWDINGESLLPPYNPVKTDPKYAASGIEESLKYVDTVTLSTMFLARCFRTRFGKDAHVSVVPNLLPHMWYGHRNHRLTEDLEKPKVVYGGSPTHYTDSSVGDFVGPWVPWMIDAVNNDKIELHMFGYKVTAEFLKPIADKIILHEPAPACEWGSALRDVEGDIYIAPLEDNLFNSCKSNLKLLEASACGMAMLGSNWADGPYGEAHELSKVDNSWSVDQLQSRVDEICRKDTYNEIMQFQDGLISKYWIENDANITQVLRVWCGSSLEA